MVPPHLRTGNALQPQPPTQRQSRALLPLGLHLFARWSLQVLLPLLTYQDNCYESRNTYQTVSFEQMQAQPRHIHPPQQCPHALLWVFRITGVKSPNLSWGTCLPRRLLGMVLQVYSAWSIQYCWETGTSWDPE